MKVLKNALSLYALSTDIHHDEVISSIDQRIKILDVNAFKAMSPIGDKNVGFIEDATSEFSFSLSNAEITKRIEYFRHCDDVGCYWNNSFDFIKDLITGSCSAIPEGISESIQDYLNKKNNEHHEEKIDIYSFIDTAFLKEDFVREKIDNLKFLFNGRVPEAGDHIVFYSTHSPESLDTMLFKTHQTNDTVDNNAYAYKDFYEYHGIMLDSEHLIGQPYGRFIKTADSLNPMTLESFLSSMLVTNQKTFKKPYIVDSSSCQRKADMIQLLEEKQYERVYSNPWPSIIKYCQTGTPLNNALQYDFEYSISRRKKIYLKNLSHRLSVAINFATQRTNQRFTTNSISKAIGRPKQTVYNWINGLNIKKAPPADDLLKIVQHLEVINPFWLFFGEGEISIPENFMDNIDAIKKIKKQVSYYKIPAFNKDTNYIQKICSEYLEKKLSNTEYNLLNRTGYIKLESRVIVNFENDEISTEEADNKHSFLSSTENKKIPQLEDYYNKNELLFIENKIDNFSPTINQGDYVLIAKLEKSYDPFKYSFAYTFGKGDHNITLGMFLIAVNGTLHYCQVTYDSVFGIGKILLKDNGDLEQFIQYQNKEYIAVISGKEVSQTGVRFIGKVLSIEKYPT